MNSEVCTGPTYEASMSEKVHQRLRGRRRRQRSGSQSALSSGGQVKQHEVSVKNKEKRKSEVLIAAQSLDNELQNVKNLKRLSIGSMDLLVDPEMEFRVKGGSGGAAAMSGPTPETGGYVEEEGEQKSGCDESDDSYSFSEESISTNREDVLRDVESSMQIGENSDQRRRTLSGSTIGRKGSHILSSRSKIGRRNCDLGTSKRDICDPLSNNLLWVRADQHPNVKPENYLELVSDTLNNLQLEERHQDTALEGSEREGALKTGVTESKPANDPVVRRPSRLRKSYTEADGLEDLTEENSQKEKPYKHKRVSSLKEITEELTRISNNAGLTDSDAVTLARTLGLGTVDSGDKNKDEDQTNAKTDTDVQDEEYASNIVTKNGLAIPPRSSLRRSKFNTYRIRSNKNSLASSTNSASGFTAAEEAPTLLLEPESQQTDTMSSLGLGNTPKSPNSINDIYDHYNTTDSDEYFSDLQSSPTKNTPERDHELSPDLTAHVQSKKQSKAPSKTSPAEGTPSHGNYSTITTPSQSPLHCIPPNAPPKERKKSHDKKKSTWSWFNSKSSPVESVSKSVSSTTVDKLDPSKDYSVLSNMSPASEHGHRRVNHTRNRHQKPLTEIPNTHSPKVSAIQGSDRSPKSNQHRRKEKLERKFMRIFKKKVSLEGQKEELKKHLEDKQNQNYDNAYDVTSSPVLPTTSLSLKGPKDKPPHEELKYGDDQQQDIENQFQELIQTKGDVLEDESSDNTQKTPGLQPAVNVTSVKDSKSTITNQQRGRATEQRITSFNNASSPTSVSHEAQLQDRSSLNEPCSPTSSGDNTDALTKTTPSSSQSNAVTYQHQEPPYTLPPRKLTFSDVVRPEQPNAPMDFIPSAFGFPLPPLTVSTVIMFDHRLPIFVERAIYRLSHLKLSDPKRELRQQVLLSNFMYSYLNLVNHSLYLQQIEEESGPSMNIESADNNPAKACSISIPEM